MKKIILMAALPFAFMACKNGGTEVAKEARTQQMTIDSLKTEIVKQQIIDSMNRVATIPVNNVPLNNEIQPVASPVASPVTAESQPRKTHSRVGHAKHVHHNSYNGYNDNAYAGNYNAPASYNNGSNYNDYQQPVQQKTRKGWNNKLKGGVIGVGAGAIAGALIDHNKGRGAILGGLLGGGAGLGVGALLDRRQGN